jgi:hypothetical protein
MGYRKHSGVEVEGIVVRRTSESGGHISLDTRSRLRLPCIVPTAEAGRDLPNIQLTKTPLVR